MVEIDEIRRRIKEGKRKWAKPLLQYVNEKLSDGYTYEAVSEWLLKEYDIDVAAKKLIDLKSKHNKYQSKKTTHLLTSKIAPKKQTTNEKTEIDRNQSFVLKQDDITNQNNDLLDLFDKTGTKNQPIEKAKGNPFKK